MNTSNQKTRLPITLRAKKSLLGKVIYRVAGEEDGAVMMEYVIVAVLIAAACALGAYFFGRSTNNSFHTASMAVAAANTEAAENAEKNQDKQQDLKSTADISAKKFIKDANETDADL